MKYKLTYSVRDLVDEKVKEIALNKKGVYCTIQPETSDVESFKEYEVVFENCEDLNSFIYGAYMSVGVYFFVKEISRTSYVF